MQARIFSFVLGLLTLTALVALCFAEHRPGLAWMHGYRGANGGGCCDDLDCVEATVALLERGALTSLVLIGDTELALPNASVHPSADPHGRGFWCFQATFITVQPGWTRMRSYVDMQGVERAVPPETPTRENTRCAFFASFS